MKHIHCLALNLILASLLGVGCRASAAGSTQIPGVDLSLLTPPPQEEEMVAQVIEKPGGSSAAGPALAPQGAARGGWLGIKFIDKPQGSERLPLGQVVVLEVVPGSPAAMAGIQAGDTIHAMQGQSMSRAQELLAVVQALPPGSQLALALLRAGQLLTPTVTLGVPPGGTAQVATGESVTPTPSPPASLATEVVYRSPTGLELRHPRGWTAEPAKEDGWVFVKGTEGERMLIGPVITEARLDARTAAKVLQQLAYNAGNRQTWSQPQAVADNAMKTIGTGNGLLAVASLWWTPMPQGTTAMLYVVSAPEQRFPTETFSHILSTVKIAGSGGQAVPQTAFVSWRDPREGAFSVAVPQGWQIGGGTARGSAVDVRFVVTAASPSGQIRVFIGDPDIPPHQVPDSMMMQYGLREGQTLSSFGTSFLLRQYRPGAEYAQDYIGWKLCRQPTIEQGQALADETAQINAALRPAAMPGMTLRGDVGEVTGRCVSNGREVKVYAMASTLFVGVHGGAQIWVVQQLSGYVTDGGQVPLARSIFHHMLASFTMDPQWVARQQKTTGAVSDIVTKAGDHTFRTIQQIAKNKAEADDRISIRRERSILGVRDVVDPVTGREFRIQNSSNYDWINPNGTIVGTNTDSTPFPGYNFRPLVEVQP